MHILAVLAEARSVRACLDGAWAAAAIEPDATVEALHVKVDPDKLTGVAPEEIAIQRLREPHEGSAEYRANEVRSAFRTWLGNHPGAPSSRVLYKEVVGAEETISLEEAKKADLTVIARPHDLDAHDALHALIFSADRPLLMPSEWSVPDHGMFGKHIAVAWKSTCQALAAIQGAKPWLLHAKRVTMITIGEDQNEIQEGMTLLRGLGISPELQTIPLRAGGDLASKLVGTVDSVGADTLVIGAYRHNELVEWAFGSTTKSLIESAKIPLFLAH